MNEAVPREMQLVRVRVREGSRVDACQWPRFGDTGGVQSVSANFRGKIPPVPRLFALSTDIRAGIEANISHWRMHRPDK